MASKWVNESIKLAMDPEKKYLDKLLEVYPAAPAEREIELNEETKKRIKTLFEEIDTTDGAVELITYLIHSFKKFPIKYPYVAFLRELKKKKGVKFLKRYLKENKNLVNILRDQLKEIGVEGIYAGITAPKEANRRMGTLFPKWLERKFKKNFRDKNSLIKESEPGIYFLKGSDKQLLDFAQAYLGYSSNKRPDFIGKVVSNNGKQFFIVGEAKFLTDYGGHQDRQLDDALHLLTEVTFNPKIEGVGKDMIIPVAVLDGVVWIEGPKDAGMIKKVKDLPDDKVALSALLLEDFLNCLLEKGDLTRCIK